MGTLGPINSIQNNVYDTVQSGIEIIRTGSQHVVLSYISSKLLIVYTKGENASNWNRYIQNLKLNILSHSVWQGLQLQLDKANLMFPLLLLSLMVRTSSLLAVTARIFSFQQKNTKMLEMEIKKLLW